MKKIISILVVVCFLFVICIVRISFLEESADLALKNNDDSGVNLSSESIDVFSKKIEVLIQNNQLEYFPFQNGEKAICIYEGAYDSDLMGDKFAIYKETSEKNIIFVNMLFVETNTGNIYTWNEENLTLIDGIGKENIELIDIFEYENSQNLLLENINNDELLDNVVEVLVQNGFDDLKLLYDGTCDFINRKYYVVSSANDLKDHIIREQTFYIDMENGYIYQADENNDYLRTELYYVGSFQ